MTTLHGGTAPLAALTTVFTPPCSTSWLVTTTKLPSQFPSFPAAGPTTCDPPAWSSNLAGEGFQYYSPAICPDGFEVGQDCTLATTPRTAEGFPAVAADETVAWCVPSGQTCTSDTTDFRGGIWGVSRTATGASVTVTVGPAMQIRWRDVDLSILATHPLTPGLTLAGDATTTSSTTSPTTTSTTTAATTTPSPPAVDESSEDSSTTTSRSPENSGTAATATTAGFITVKGKSTQGTPTPVTTVSVVTSGSTFVSTVVTSPTAAAQGGDGSSGGDGAGTGANTGSNNSNSSDTTTGSSNKETTGGSPSMRAYTAAVTVASLLSATAVGIIAFFIWSRRRRQRRNQAHAHDSDAGSSGNTAQATANKPAELPDSSSVGLSSVGVGAWVQRRRPRWRVLWMQGKTWWSGLRLLRGRSPLTGDNLQSRWQRRQRRQDAAAQCTQSRARTPMAELPTSERALADYAELEGCPVSQQNGEEGEEAADDDADSYISFKKGIPPQPGSRDRSSARLSWMSRLSRYMRGGAKSRRSEREGGEGGGGGDALSDDAASTVSRASTRWSRWTRTDTASVLTADGGDGDDSNANTLDESSWEAFSRSRDGLGKLRFVKQKGTSGGKGGRRAGAGLTVPGNAIIRLPSPAITVRSDRTGTPGLPGSNRFSRLSDGTFGRMDSYISRAGSRIGDAPGGGGGGGGPGGGDNISEA